MEIWKDIEGFDGYYSVSSYGRVRANKRRIEKSNGVVCVREAREMVQTESKDGYLTVKLSANGRSKRIPVHRLVASAFLPHCKGVDEVNHKDFNRKNNHVENLEWVTHAGNIEKTIAAGRHISQARDMSGASNPNYGNRALSRKYQSDAALSKEKQSRPGERNGRSRKVEMVDAHGGVYEFPYIGACAKYLVERGLYKCDATNAAVRISEAAKNGTPFLGMKYRFKD